ncbi:hypothetical protein HZA43_01315 [Candidatus Peregrinibacteria bacterium]|nr:hypothetical protein [Candidatus Peregrinibacteria bacterium]
MKNIFKRTDFSRSPGGNRYEWKSAETVFKVLRNGFFAIKIDAACKGAGQNKSSDDDDLRVALDGEIWPDNFSQDNDMKGEINFTSADLAKSIHGIRKIEYKSSKLSGDSFDVKLNIFDVYDFQKGVASFFYPHFEEYLTQAIVNDMDIGEELEIIKNYEIEIHITETIHVR